MKFPSVLLAATTLLLAMGSLTLGTGVARAQDDTPRCGNEPIIIHGPNGPIIIWAKLGLKTWNRQGLEITRFNVEPLEMPAERDFAVYRMTTIWENTSGRTVDSLAPIYMVHDSVQMGDGSVMPNPDDDYDPNNPGNPVMHREAWQIGNVGAYSFDHVDRKLAPGATVRLTSLFKVPLGLPKGTVEEVVFTTPTSYKGDVAGFFMGDGYCGNGPIIIWTPNGPIIIWPRRKEVDPRVSIDIIGAYATFKGKDIYDVNMIFQNTGREEIGGGQSFDVFGDTLKVPAAQSEFSTMGSAVGYWNPEDPWDPHNPGNPYAIVARDPQIVSLLTTIKPGQAFIGSVMVKTIAPGEFENHIGLTGK